ncbi:MerR family transcriptional regulator [Shewanella sp. Scap07]|uniref:MerR family transcriptional regulator n=1 Tax=Shewanella sp. Scap07 TaxID=2589987 RepID=UPI0015BC44DA|nr:MerR family transcriptional regulator [Shewanella sp. Scap07]QLE86560.1 MerR family transcriptional regulator [Shewanella sp. Scap07]
MYTVSQLAKQCNISRTSVLYYERQRLLKPAMRGDNGYRWYGEPERQRLQMIVSYRAYGLPVTHIAQLLDDSNGQSQPQLLKQHFNQLEAEIDKLKQQQRAIIVLLKAPELLDSDMISKQRWVEIMIEAGFDEAAMTRWHQKFELMEPTEHQRFLETLGIEAEEIALIRGL